MKGKQGKIVILTEKYIRASPIQHLKNIQQHTA
jgi:hypothetical protein